MFSLVTNGWLKHVKTINQLYKAKPQAGLASPADSRLLLELNGIAKGEVTELRRVGVGCDGEPFRDGRSVSII